MLLSECQKLHPFQIFKMMTRKFRRQLRPWPAFRERLRGGGAPRRGAEGARRPSPPAFEPRSGSAASVSAWFRFVTPKDPDAGRVPAGSRARPDGAGRGPRPGAGVDGSRRERRRSPRTPFRTERF